MTTTYLRTKLYQPAIHQPFVSRTHLVEALSAGLLVDDVFARKLTAVSAPAGFGKTTLVCEWLNSLSLLTAWLSLDGQDNDPVRFFSYVVAALQTIPVLAEANLGETAQAMLHAPQMPDLTDMLANLVNEGATAAIGSVQVQPIILVLDDYHVIQSRVIHEALTFLLDNMPPQWHLVIASRSDPPLPLPRMRAQRQLLEVREADLRFSEVETAVFLQQSLGIDLAPTDIRTLETRTEGWIAGLQLAALSLQGQSNPTAFIENFSGGHRYILDYLMAEVLQKQPDYLQHFLLQTAVLERMCAPLCAKLLETGDWNLEVEQSPISSLQSQQILEHLERTNLFTIPLDDERRWYRYHHLFGELLRARLQQTMPERVADLHRRASLWHQANDDVDEAVAHAFASGDDNLTVSLMARSGMAKLFRGEMSTLSGWLARLPEPTIVANASLCVLDGWLKLFTGELKAVAMRLEQAEASAPSVTEDPDLHGSIVTLRAYFTSFTMDTDRTLAYAQRALELLDVHNGSARSIVIYTQATSYIVRNELELAINALGETGRLGGASGNVHMAVPALGTKAGMEIIMGRLRQAEQTITQAMPLAKLASGQDSPIAARLYSTLCQLAYERNDLETAVTHAQTALTLGRQWGNADVLTRNPCLLAEIRIAQGDFAAADDMLQMTDSYLAKFGRDSLSPGLVPNLQAVRVFWWLAQGDVDTALRWTEREGLTPDINAPVNFLQEVSYLTLAQILIWAGQRESARQLLAGLLESAQAGGRRGREIRIRALLSLVADDETAVSHLSSALQLAEPERYVRTFLDLAPFIQKPLQHIIAARAGWSYPAELLAALRGEAALPQVASWQTQDGYLVEPLSEREIEVLQLISEGFSNRDIAEKLVITIGTVKSHTNHIFSKMGVKNRTQAVARARELRIL